MIDALDDLSKLTNIGKSNYISIFEKLKFILAHHVEEMICENLNECHIDLNIGKLNIYLDDNSYRYDFEPSISLNDLLKGLLNGNNKVLAKNIDKQIEIRLKSAYKELL